MIPRSCNPLLSFLPLQHMTGASGANDFSFTAARRAIQRFSIEAYCEVFEALPVRILPSINNVNLNNIMFHLLNNTQSIISSILTSLSTSSGVHGTSAQNFMITLFIMIFFNQFFGRFLASSIFLVLQPYFAERHTSDLYHIMNDGNGDDVINNDDDFVILMLAMVVFEILLAWLVVAMLLVILVLTTAVLKTLLAWLVVAMFTRLRRGVGIVHRAT